MSGAKEEPRTAAAIEPRRAGIATMIERVDQALQQMRREHATITPASAARRAGVSRSFLYQNADARALVTAAAAGHAKDASGRASAPARPETVSIERAHADDHGGSARRPTAPGRLAWPGVTRLPRPACPEARNAAPTAQHRGTFSPSSCCLCPVVPDAYTEQLLCAHEWAQNLLMR